MTNREWLATLNNEEFVAWLCDENKATYNHNYPTRKEIALMYSDSRSGLLNWLEEERE